jgi:hypothetical protein
MAKDRADASHFKTVEEEEIIKGFLEEPVA